ncbi:MAG: hypothetical protein KF752_15535 [Pirellulaceae bacterium]|nr:hypothetical protein [Pirellulaceae bacterium]MBX3422966.1 hypothetical protein [Pirellulaceae bacterium]
MVRPNRSEQFSPDEVAIVHTVQRCVRRAFLAGQDQQSGKDYSYRREWIRRRLESLASVFGIDVLTYAVMSNHIHTILRSRPDVVAGWTDEQVALRWLSVFPGLRLEELHLAQPTDVQVATLVGNQDEVKKIRRRLSDISWFMRALAEPIARMANAEDQCTGRFWEGRFKAQRITDEAGLLACAMYVDLNPVRAAMADSPEDSVHTSAYDRLQAELGVKIQSTAFELQAIPQTDVAKARKETPVQQLRKARQAKRRSPTGRRVLRDSWLSPLTMDDRVLAQDAQTSRTGLRASDKGFLNISWRQYLELLSWTARQRVKEFTEAVPESLKSVLSQLGIEASMWRDLVWNFKRYFGKSSCAGSPGSMSAEAERHGKRWHRGQAQVRECFA